MPTLYIRIALWAALAAAVLAGLTWWTNSIEQRGYDRATTECKAARDKEDLARTRATLRQSEINREEEARRQAEKVKATRETAENLRRARDDAVAADRAAAGLRDQLAVFVADARHRADVPAHPASGAGVAPAGSALDLLADMLGAVESAGRAMAGEADKRGAAGTGCQREHDSLNH